VNRHILIGGVEIGLVRAGVDDACLGIVRRIDHRDRPHELKRVDMGAYPGMEVQGEDRFGIGIVACPQGCHEEVPKNGCEDQRDHGGDTLQEATGRLPYEELSPRQAYHHTRPHAGIPQTASRMASLPHRQLGGEIGALDRGDGKGDHGEEAPSRAGLQVLPRDHETRRYGEERLGAACKRALFMKAYSYKSLESILKNNLDGRELPSKIRSVPVTHENIRGNAYYK
jgi:hypothetical protein